MNNKKLLIIAFIALALAQLYVPAKMIFTSEDVLANGTLFKFKVAPFDPSDPFRGKYITLRFDENSYDVSDKDHWWSNEDIYVSLSQDSLGFAKIESVSREIPEHEENFIKAKVDYISGDTIKTIRIQYPFDRFYMEESKAPDAENAYQQSQRGTNQTAWALVSVKNGHAVLNDVLLNGIPIIEVVRANQKLK